MNLQSAKTNLKTPHNTRINLSHTLHTSTDFMYFKPLLVQEMLPTDSFDVTISDYFRANVLPNPVYGEIQVSKAAFFVPNRILWKEWNTFLTGGQNGRETRTMPSYRVASLLSYLNASTLNAQMKHLTRDFLTDMGIPRNILEEGSQYGGEVSALPFRAVKRVWWDWYRDSNLIGDEVEDTYNAKGAFDPVEVAPSGAGFSSRDNIHPMPVPFEKDYFTTAFQEPQRGEDSYAPVVLPDARLNPSLAHVGATNNVVTNGGVVGQQSTPSGATDVIGRVKYNAIRLAHGLQHWLERNNIAGANALQQLLAHWGTAPNPAVFQRSVFINDSDSLLNIDEVVNTSEDQGNVTTKANGSAPFHTSYTANEHGYLIIIQIMRPKTGYYQGIDRSLTRFDRFDYFTPEMECTGFQPIYRRELYASVNNADGIFGYAPRYAEYKFKNNRVTGDYADENFGRYLHLNRDLKDMNDSALIETISPNFTAGYNASVYGGDFSRIFEDGNVDFDHFLQVCQFKIHASRPMRGYDVPIFNEEEGSDVSIPYAGVRL